jgi:poly(beta-D-mannuronate) lyase
MRLKTTLNYRSLSKRLSFKTCVFTLILCCNYGVFSQTRTTPGVPQTFTITSPSALTATFSTNLIPGDIVELANGTYSSSATMKINGVGTEALPITYKPATPGGVTFTGGQTMDIGGDWCIVEGFRWKGGVGTSNFIEFRDGTNYAYNSILKNCVVDGVTVSGGINPLNGVSTKHNWLVLYGANNTVINCSFLNKNTSGNMILAEYQFNASADGSGTPNTRCDVVGHKILNNYFYNYSKIDATATNSGDSEAIRIGTSEYQNVNSNAIVQNNYFVQADGENEIITNKSKGNSYINNTFRKCRGSLVLRHGSHTTVNGNYFLGENIEGTGGIRIVDSNQSIRNNYIQDCITTTDNAIWNNGITFLGGNDTSAVDCSSTSMTNGYQKVQNIDVSNNTIVNTNAPLFFNINTGTTKPLGTVSNNLIYFASGNSNITPVITGNTTSPIAMGTGLTYSGNEYSGTTLGETTYTGFSENTGISANTSGEIFTFTGAAVKGADMGVYTPITDGMVGYGIGACFVNNTGDLITGGDCNVVIPESLIVSTLPTLTYEAISNDVTVTANIGWTAVSNDAWITTVNPNSGSGDATVSITVTENTGTESRTGTVTFTGTGADTIVRTLTITQDAPPPPDPREGLNLINVNASDVEAVFACHEETPAYGHTKDNPMGDSLDKNPDTQWAGSAALGGCVDYVSIIYDLKGAFDLDLVDIATTSGKTYNLQIWVSSTVPDAPATYPADGDFILAYPSSGFFQISTTPTVKVPYTISPTAAGTRYVKIVGDGQPAGSRYTTIHEIEFYGNSSTLSIADKNVNQIKIYPNPVKEFITLKNIKNNVSLVQIFTIDGRKVMEKSVKYSEQEILLDMTPFENGAYILNISNGSETKQSKMIMVSH